VENCSFDHDDVIVDDDDVCNMRSNVEELAWYELPLNCINVDCG
jgi:hypothetical protein